MITTISIDRFGQIDSLDLKLNRFHKVDKSSGDDSLLTMLRALTQSFVPGYAHDWQLFPKPGESAFGSGKLAVRGKLLMGGTFADSLYEDSKSCSCAVEFVLENPENPVKPASSYADKKRAGADDFRELCRMYGEKFSSVRRFVVGVEVSFAQRNDDNILSYQMVSVRCERVWDEDIASFFELVLYRNGTNYDLYWDELPDIRTERQSGRAKGCNVRMRNLAVLDIVTDGVQDGARFMEVLPRIVALSRIAAGQFQTLRFVGGCGETRKLPGACEETRKLLGSCVETQKFFGPCIEQVAVQGPCYFVGARGEYTEAVIRTYTEGRIRISWPDPATGEVRHGLFAEAFEAWRAELEGEDDSCPGAGVKQGASLAGEGVLAPSEMMVLVQGLILRTGETLVLGDDGGLPEKFFVYLSRMGRQVLFCA